MSDEPRDLQTITAADVGALPAQGGSWPGVSGTRPAPPPQALEPIMQYFSYKHLPPPLATISAQFSTLAEFILEHTPRCAERTVALRKLLESKDAAVRAALAKDPR